MAENTIATPTMLATFETGVGRGSLSMTPYVKEDGTNGAAGEDDLYNYTLNPYDSGLNGTLFVRNKQTGEMKAIPVCNHALITRKLKIHLNEQVTGNGVAGLVDNFGTRQAQRIQKMRQTAGK